MLFRSSHRLLRQNSCALGWLRELVPVGRRALDGRQLAPLRAAARLNDVATKPSWFLGLLECWRDLNALARYFRGWTAVEQIVGRERYQRACHRHLVRNAVASRRVNSNVRAHRYLETSTQTGSAVMGPGALGDRAARQLGGLGAFGC